MSLTIMNINKYDIILLLICHTVTYCSLNCRLLRTIKSKSESDSCELTVKQMVLIRYSAVKNYLPPSCIKRKFIFVYLSLMSDHQTNSNTRRLVQ